MKSQEASLLKLAVICHPGDSGILERAETNFLILKLELRGDSYTERVR